MVRAKTALTIALAAFVGLAVGCGEQEAPLHRSVVTPDGKSVVETAKSGEKQIVVRDRKQVGGEYDRVFPPVLSPDGGSVAFIAKSGDKYTVIKDGEAVCKPRALVLNPTYSPDGKSFAYAEPQGDNGAEWSVMKDGKRVGDLYARVGPPAFSPDSQSIAFAATKDGKTFVVRDGELTGAGDDDIRQLAFTPDGRALVYVAVDFDTGKRRLMRAGQKVSADYERIWGWAASPDGQSLAWVVRRDGQDVLVKDGVEVGGPFTANEVVGPVFAPDGRAVGFAVGHGKWRMKKDDAQLGDAFDADYVRELLFSPNGSSLACSATVRRSAFVLKDGKRVGGTYRAVSALKNSADGAHFEFHGLSGRRTRLVRIPW